MQGLQRNRLVWLQPQAWADILGRHWDAQALEILHHWAAADLPLVVTRQRPQVPPHQVCLGLPAPTRWMHRRLALETGQDGIRHLDGFPAYMNGPAELCGHDAQIYGSRGWQYMTGMEYVHPQSDLDLLIHTAALGDAVHCASALEQWSAPWRVDGEVVFPGGYAVAWRELLQAHVGKAGSVLVKHRQRTALMGLRDLENLTTADGAVHPAAAVA